MQLHHHLWSVLKWTIAVVLGTGSLLAVIDQFLGRPWPTDPEIHPLDFVSGTPLTHLFKVQNRMAFDMTNVEFTCGVQLFAAKDANGKLIGGSDFAFVTGQFSIPRGHWINYACDASSLVIVNPDQSLSFRREMQTKPGNFKGPLSIAKMCLWIGGKYRFAGMDWTFRSLIFKWPAAQNDPHWVEGFIAQEPIDIRGKGIDALECDSTVRFPYVLFTPASRAPLLILK